MIIFRFWISVSKKENDNKVIEITPFEEYINKYNGYVYYRKLNIERNDNFNFNFKNILEKIHNKQPDLTIIDWFDALLKSKETRTVGGTRIFVLHCAGIN